MRTEVFQRARPRSRFFHSGWTAPAADKEAFLHWAGQQRKNGGASPADPAELARRWFKDKQAKRNEKPVDPAEIQKLARRYHTHESNIQAVLKETGVPEDLFFTFALAESSIRPEVRGKGTSALGSGLIIYFFPKKWRR